MKVISLNIWGGRLYNNLLQFIAQHASTTDIFCFQEVFDTNSDRTESNGSRVNILSELEKALPQFKTYFSPSLEGIDIEGPVDFPLLFGLAMFTKKELTIQEQGEVWILGSFEDRHESKPEKMPRNLQYVILVVNGKELVVSHMHGYWWTDKEDNPVRLLQSQNVTRFLNSLPGEKIFGGDLNLMPQTKSIQILEKGMKNLIKDFDIKQTRNEYYTKPMRFADYMFVTPGVKVGNFAVPNVTASDHLPLILEFE